MGLLETSEPLLRPFAAYLNRRYPTDQTIRAVVVREPRVRGTAGNGGVATFVHPGDGDVGSTAGPGLRIVIGIPDSGPWLPPPFGPDEAFRLDPLELHRDLAHEFCHFLQYLRGARMPQEFDEEEAEAFAQRVVAEWAAAEQLSEPS